MFDFDTVLEKFDQIVDIPFILNELSDIGCLVYPTGSRVTCSPAPTGSDWDYLIYIRQDKFESLLEKISNLGFKIEGNEEYDMYKNEFVSFRKGELNLIVTCQSEFRDRHVIATKICKQLNLMDKQDRIMVFQGMLYGRYYDAEEAKILDSLAEQ